MEMEASDRDQIAYACSAQNSKLLPKKRKGKSNASGKLKSQVSPYFEGV